VTKATTRHAHRYVDQRTHHRTHRRQEPPACPSWINRSLAAADRVRYYLALLQAAAVHAQSPNQPTINLRDEREGSGIDNEALDAVVGNSRQLSPDVCLIPRANEIFDALSSDLRLMAEPLRIAAVADAELNERVDGYEHRVAEHLAQLPRNDDDHIPTRALDASSRRGAMARHRPPADHRPALGAESSARRRVGRITRRSDGLRLTETDRQLLRAFMRGVNETAPLKFDHEGTGDDRDARSRAPHDSERSRKRRRARSRRAGDRPDGDAHLHRHPQGACGVPAAAAGIAERAVAGDADQWRRRARDARRPLDRRAP
jgi:hypothetical protein